jgi:hypothetical protein
MSAAPKKQVQRFLMLLSLALFLFNGRALADSTVIAYTTLDWAAASFSGAVTPTNFGLVETDGLHYLATGAVDPGSFLINSSEHIGWEAANSTVQFNPSTFALATAGTELTALASATDNYQVNATTERTGIISSADGFISIDIPYTFSIIKNLGPGVTCCSFADTQVDIEITAETNGVDFDFGNGTFLAESLTSSGNDSTSGNLLFQGVPLTSEFPVTYFFQVEAFSQVNLVVPEPSTFPLLGMGMVGLAGLILRKRFA